jgi:hypothetical protein
LLRANGSDQVVKKRKEESFGRVMFSGGRLERVEKRAGVDKLAILMIVGRRTGIHFCRSHVGIGSRSCCLSGEFITSLNISSVKASEESDKIGGAEG